MRKLKVYEQSTSGATYTSVPIIILKEQPLCLLQLRSHLKKRLMA